MAQKKHGLWNTIIPGLALNVGHQKPPAAGSGDLLVNLVAYWDFDEASGTRADSHASFDFSDHNTVGASATGGPDSGQCADFNHIATEYFTQADSASFTPSSDMAAAGWVYIDDDTAGSIRYFLTHWGYGTGANAQRCFQISYNVDSDIFQTYFSKTGSSPYCNPQATTFQASPGFALNTWYFVYTDYDSSAGVGRICINNGTKDSDTVTAGTLFNAGVTLLFGEINDDSQIPEEDQTQNMAGRASYWGFWHRLLTDDEITFLYNSGAGRNYAAVAAY